MNTPILDSKLKEIYNSVVNKTLHHVVIENRIEKAMREWLFETFEKPIDVRVEEKNIQVLITEDESKNLESKLWLLNLMNSQENIHMEDGQVNKLKKKELKKENED